MKQGFFVFFLALVVVKLALAEPSTRPDDNPPPPTNADIDRHALLATQDVELSLDRLAEYLTKDFTKDRDKVRAIYRWIADRISYDVDALLTNHPGEVRPEAVLRGRQATCFGYAALFETLARRAGLEAAIIPGFVKGVTNPDENRPFRPNHAWNAVKIESRWHLVDVTLGSGYVRLQRFRKVFQEQFFLPPAHHLLLTHYPVDPRWQLVPVPLGPHQWDRMPHVDMELFSMGITMEALCRQMQAPGFRGFVRAYAQHTSAKILSVPLGSHLAPGYDYYFLIDAPQTAQLALVQKDRWVPMRKIGTRFEGIIRPEPGELKLNVQPRPQDRRYQTLLVYQVNEW
jgi:hypothetical protein